MNSHAPTIRIGSLVLLWALVQAASGACLLDDYSVKAEFSRSSFVVIGTVVGESKIPADTRTGYEDGINYKIHVDRKFRGNPHKYVDVFSEDSSGRFPMLDGKTYVLFIYQENGRFFVDNCGNSGLLNKKQGVIEFLGKF